jgi:hypothetical protein
MRPPDLCADAGPVGELPQFHQRGLLCLLETLLQLADRDRAHNRLPRNDACKHELPAGRP